MPNLAPLAEIRGKSAIHTKKIYDACRDKDCVENIRVYFPCEAQEAVDRASAVKPRVAELMWIFVDVEPIGFNRGFYTIDLKYFYKVCADVFCGLSRPLAVEGVASFDKRVILFGSEGSAKIYSSKTHIGGLDRQVMAKANLPTAVVEAVDPMILGSKLRERRDCCHPHPHPHPYPVAAEDVFDIPDFIGGVFGEFDHARAEKHLYVTLGQFSIVRLERDSQILVPGTEFSIPEKECCAPADGEPCDVFKRVRFPVDDFFPPDTLLIDEPRLGPGCGCK